MLKGNAIISQSGGPTSVINSSLAGIIDAAKAFEGIDKILGMRFAVGGFITGDVVDLGAEAEYVIEGLKTTPGSALGACRYKLREEDLPLILDMLKKYNVRYMFSMGGNGTMGGVQRVEEYARQQGYEMICIGVPKTVDNDLFGTDHAPGYGSAARYIAMSVLQAGILARDMQKVDDFVVMQTVGRNVGWLAAGAAAAKKRPEDPPHILCLPERAFDKNKFLAKVKKCHEQFGFVSIVCGEGITFADGRAVSVARNSDEFESVEFGATGGASSAIALHRMISDEFGFRGEFQITESLAMCGADRTSDSDIEEAYMAGQAAVALAKAGKTGLMVTLERKSNRPYKCVTGEIALSEVAIKAKPMPDNYINEEGDFVTEEFLDYLRPLIGELPEYARLAYKKV